MKGDRSYDESVNQVVLGIVEGTGIIQYEKQLTWVQIESQKFKAAGDLIQIIQSKYFIVQKG